MSQKENKSREKSVARRTFLSKIALVSAVTAGIMAVLGIFRLSIPRVFREKSIFKIGYFDDFPLNTFTLIADKKVFIYRDRQNIKALSAVCTHLGCVVTKTPEGFQCPCHGSFFDHTGKVLSGPAPRSLPWHTVDSTPGGLLYIDLNQKVDFDEKLIL